MNVIEIDKDTYNVVLDMRYATENNVVGKPFYARAACFLHEEAAAALQIAVALAEAQGLRLKIFDAFRPKEAQQTLWEAYPNPNFVSNPESGSCPHCRGVAVDLTLIDGAGTELEMGTEFDDFTEKAHHGNNEVSAEVQKNRYLLMGIMMTAGWDFYRNEWWHYQLFNCRDYPLLSDEEAGTKLI